MELPQLRAIALMIQRGRMETVWNLCSFLLGHGSTVDIYWAGRVDLVPLDSAVDPEQSLTPGEMGRTEEERSQHLGLKEFVLFHIVVYC